MRHRKENDIERLLKRSRLWRCKLVMYRIHADFCDKGDDYFASTRVGDLMLN
jgi:hypothetical protein